MASHRHTPVARTAQTRSTSLFRGENAVVIYNQHATNGVEHAPCGMQHAAYSTQHATNHVSRTPCTHHRAHPAVRHPVRSASFVSDAPVDRTLEGTWRAYRRFSRTAKRCKSSKRPCGSPPPCFSALDRAHTTASLEASRLSWQAACTRRDASHATGPTLARRPFCMVLCVRLRRCQAGGSGGRRAACNWRGTRLWPTSSRSFTTAPAHWAI